MTTKHDQTQLGRIGVAMRLAVWPVAAVVIAYSAGEGHRLLHDRLGVDDPWAWFLTPAVDVALCAALYVSGVLNRYGIRPLWLKAVRWGTAIMTLWLNTTESVLLAVEGGPAAADHWVSAITHTFPALLLIGLTEADESAQAALLRRIEKDASKTSAPAAESTPVGAGTDAGAGRTPAPAPAQTPVVASLAAGPTPESAPVPAVETAPEAAPPVVVESAPVVPSPAAPVSAPEGAPVEVSERSAPPAPVAAPERPTGAPERARPEHRTGARSNGRHRSTSKSRSAQRSGAPSRDEKISAAVDAIVAHYKRFAKKPSQRELKIALEFPPRNDDMARVYELADEALARKAVNS